MKHYWEYKKLGEVCDIYQPKTISTSMLVENGQYPVYGANGIIGRYDQYNHTNKELLMTCRGATCGTINVSQPYSWINGNAMVIHPLSNEIYFDFLKYQLASLDLSNVITGAAQPQITRQSLSPLTICIPPIKEQEEICSLLDKLSLVIEKKKQQVKELDNLAQAIFYDMFGDPVENERGWETKQLGDCFTYIKNGVNIKQDKTQSGLPITRIETLSNGVFNRDRMGYAGITDIVKYQQYILNDKDLLMSHINSKAYIGRTVMYAKKGDETIIHGMNLLRLVPVEDLESVFFCYMTKSDYFKKKIANIRKDAVNQSSFAISDLKKIAVPIPPLPLQQSFAQKVEAIERQKELINQSIREAQTLFDSRMEYYFGE